MVANVTDWITLPRLYSQYVGTDLHAGVVNIAKDAFDSASGSFNMTLFDIAFLVLSFYPSLTGDFVPSYDHPILSRTGILTGFAVVEEDRDWSAYARAFALSLGLWRVQNQLSGIGSNDLAASGEGEMSVWSKLAMGWVNDSQVVNVDAPVASRILILDPVEDPGSDALALRISLGSNVGAYWVEVRQSLGYDRNNLQDYGAIVTYVPSSDASIQLKKVLQPDIISKAIFIDSDSDLSIIVLNVTQGRYRLLLGDAETGRNAQTTVYAITRAQEAIQSAAAGNRFGDLDMAQELLANAHKLFELGKFTDASAMAVSAETTANTATVPPDYPQAAQLLEAADALKNSTSTDSSSQSALLIQQAETQLEIARHAFETRDFATAKQAAQSAIDLFNKAKQMELFDSILSWLSSLALIIPIIILALALRYQLKST